jgi:hypothetical protein
MYVVFPFYVIVHCTALKLALMRVAIAGIVYKKKHHIMHAVLYKKIKVVL